MSKTRTSHSAIVRRRPVGAEVQAKGGGVHFRVWAPASKRAAVELASDVIEMNPEAGGYFSVHVPTAGVGIHYRYRLDSGSFPDPASRFQPEGPHGPSQVVDPSGFKWTDKNWRGVSRRGQVIYELHIGTFTPEGTYAAAAERLDYLVSLGVTLIEVMPLADFPGRFGWGYDGVCLYAPTRLYGEPDDLRRFVDRSHALGLGVILDVVYNHFGPDGNYTGQFSPHYISKRLKNEWGDRLNFDDRHSGPVREFFIENAAYWIDEFHFDGLRLDATQQIHDRSEEHLVAAVVRRAREAAAGRGIYIVSENDEQDSRHVLSRANRGFEVDALWNDDFHYTALVAASGRREAYFSHFRGAPQEFVSVAKHGFLFQGQWYGVPRGTRGESCPGTEPDNFVTYVQNHDQVANTMLGKRIHQVATPGCLRALTAWLLLSPSTPMLFQGQEFATSSPFFYFADHVRPLAKAVAAGRRMLLKQFPSAAGLKPKELMPDPHSEETFRRCVLNWVETETHAGMLQLHRDLIALRRRDPVISEAKRGSYDGAVLSTEAFLLRYFNSSEGADRLLLVNLGQELDLTAFPEPLLAPSKAAKWELRWSSEDAAYGGNGMPAFDGPRAIPAESVLFFVAVMD